MRILPLICVALSLPLTLSAREWKSAAGTTSEFVEWKVEGEKIIFIRDGEEIPVALNQLSPEDQAFARQWEKELKKPAPKPAAAPIAKKPTKLPNGDVLIKDLPEPAVDDVITRWNALGVAAVLDAYYEWKLPLMELATKHKFDPNLDNWPFQDQFYREIGKQSKTRVSMNKTFDFDDTMKQIDAGQPLVHWRGWSAEREEKYVEFEKRLSTDPKLQLPSPRDAKEKRSWLTNVDGGTGAITAMIIGYNKERGEVLMAQPFHGPDYKCYRMRKEEMAAIGYAFFTFEPLK